MAQFARPDGDITDGGWGDTTGGDSGGDFWDEISEVTPDDGSSYIHATSADSTCEVSLTNVTDPESSTRHILERPF